MAQDEKNYYEYDYSTDEDCEKCLLYKGKSKYRKMDCKYEYCCCEEQMREAATKDRKLRRRRSKWG
ncbi:MAG: hypothetical protein LBM98_01190 [Oscillospiraceae bacterium]|jgi:hypothetical protein|nr:hypothetical protein [Oscillospiraceae bacterium]